MIPFDEAALQRQLDLETEMLEASQRQFMQEMQEARERGDEMQTPYGIQIMRKSVLAVADGITEYLAEWDAHGRGKRPVAYSMLKGIVPVLGADVVAYLTMHKVISSISGRLSFNNAAVGIGTMIEDEMHMVAFKDKSSDLAKITEKKIAKSSSLHHKRTVAIIMARRAGVEAEEWPKEDKLMLGGQLLEIAEKKTGAFHLERMGSKLDSPMMIRCDRALREWIESCLGYASLMAPRYYPTIIPPKPWTSPLGGGYYRKVGRRPLSLVKVRNRNIIEEMRNMDMTEVYEAVNHVQNTPWAINKNILNTIDRLLTGRRNPNNVLPRAEEDPLPAKPHDIDTNPEAEKRWKKMAALTYEANAKRDSHLLQFGQILTLAQKFANEPRIYFPHQMDFRGRLYPTTVLSPQGNDLTKALLTFADGKPINDSVALGWLMIHGANSWGADKLPLEERVGWAEANEANILASAADPVENQWWSEADAPWQFLAFCFEYAAFKVHGWGYVSTLPVSVDGSCNGLQHFSAMLRDEIGGRAVNLIPSDKPEDIYRRVAEEVTAELRLLACNGGTDAEMAKRCLALGIDRSITKRSVMIVPYSGTQYAMREYIERALREKVLGLGVSETQLEHDDRNPLRSTDADGVPSSGIFAASLFLSKIVWDAIGRVVVAARQAMGWLKKVAQVAAAQGLPITWITPDGFPVWQAYRVSEEQRVRTQLYGGIRLMLRVDTGEIDKKKQASSVAPNFVHSLDAAALRRYVVIAHDNGIRHFALVHDSYGTVAADAEMMGRCLREAFIDLYENHDVLADMREAVLAMIPEESRKEVPALPVKGTLDLTLVRESDFFFA
ncbi:MAG: hypothetical protein INH37_13705 [Myxococcaceae bacterium]|nr:hypothetical protein [Myxococcaceae bacterium]